MYSLPYFKVTDEGEVLEFLKAHPFALLIGCRNNSAVATQVPLLIEAKEGELVLSGHIMRSTDHHQAFEENSEVLCVFTGAHTYVSASVYMDTQTASTWNYMTVQARGRLRFVEQPALLQLLEKTTTHFEGGADTPAAYKQLPEAYIERLSKAIIGFTITVTELNHTFKLSQNRDPVSYKNIIDLLENKGDAGSQTIAAEMKLRQAGLFERK